MAGTPGLRAVGRGVAPRRHHVKFLEGIIYVEVFGETAAEGFAKVVLYLPAEDEDELAKARPLRVIDRVVQDRLAARSDGVHLFQSAVAGADAGRQNN